MTSNLGLEGRLISWTTEANGFSLYLGPSIGVRRTWKGGEESRKARRDGSRFGIAAVFFRLKTTGLCCALEMGSVVVLTPRSHKRGKRVNLAGEA